MSDSHVEIPAVLDITFDQLLYAAEAFGYDLVKKAAKRPELKVCECKRHPKPELCSGKDMFQRDVYWYECPVCGLEAPWSISKIVARERWNNMMHDRNKVRVKLEIKE